MNTLVEQYIEEIYLVEDISSIMSKIQSKKASIMAALKTKEPDKVKAVLSFLPHVPIDKIHDIASKHIVGFDLEYDKAIKKVQGNPEERQIKATSIATLYAIKKNVKIPEVRKALSDVKMDPSYAFVARDIFTGLCLIAAAYFGYLGISSIIPAIGSGVVAVGGALATAGWFIGLFISLYLLILVVAYGM